LHHTRDPPDPSRCTRLPLARRCAALCRRATTPPCGPELKRSRVKLQLSGGLERPARTAPGVPSASTHVGLTRQRFPVYRVRQQSCGHRPKQHRLWRHHSAELHQQQRGAQRQCRRIRHRQCQLGCSRDGLRSAHPPQIACAQEPPSAVPAPTPGPRCRPTLLSTNDARNPFADDLRHKPLVFDDFMKRN